MKLTGKIQEQFGISYPVIEHPIIHEKEQTKRKYLRLMDQYRRQFCDNNEATMARFQRFAFGLIPEYSPDEEALTASASEVLKTRISPFRIFSYRYIFLFDCVFLFAAANRDLAQKICDEVKLGVNSRYHKRLDEIIDQLFSPEPVLSKRNIIPDEAIQAWINTKHYLSSHEKSVLFTATMSAGKSTLINAIIGQELSYAKKAACTATVMEFCSTPVYHPLYNLISEDENAINATVADIHKHTRNQTTPCSVVGYFEAITNKKMLRLIDTPGVNSSRNPIHKKITREALQAEHYEVIIYVVPVESYGSEDDYYHLKYIKDKVRYKKILFAINMMDTCDFEDDSVIEIVSNMKSHLEEIGFSSPVVCPVSAKAGLLFKQGLMGFELSENDEAELKALYAKFVKSDYDLSQCYSTPMLRNIHCSSYNVPEIPEYDLYNAYLRTGVPELEDLILKEIEEG